MSASKSAATPAVVYIEGAARFWLDGDVVLFKLTTGEKVVCGAMSASDFIESFGRAADIAHQWSGEHYSGSRVRSHSRVSPQTSSAADRPKTSDQLQP